MQLSQLLVHRQLDVFLMIAGVQDTVSNCSNSLTHVTRFQGTSLAPSLTGDVEFRKGAGEEVSALV